MKRLTVKDKEGKWHIICNSMCGDYGGKCDSQFDVDMCKRYVAINKLAEYEQAEEDGLLPRFHLGDEFWCLYIDEVVKAKIVSLQQKKDGSWNYTLSREISENYHDIAYYKEREYGKYFWPTKAEAEQALAKMKGGG